MRLIDKTWIGITLGLIMPVVTSVLFHRYGYNGQLGYADFLHQMLFLGTAAMLVAVSCLPTLAIFTFCAFTDHLKISRGLFLSTLLYAFMIVILKVFF